MSHTIDGHNNNSFRKRLIFGRKGFQTGNDRRSQKNFKNREEKKNMENESYDYVLSKLHSIKFMLLDLHVLDLHVVVDLSVLNCTRRIKF